MPSQNTTNGERVLRIGIVEDDRILDERELPARKTISFGTTERNDFVVAGPGVSSRFEVFQYVDGGYVLNFPDAMRGRVAVPVGSGELAELRSSGHAKSAGNYHQIRLDGSSRGRLEFGDIAIVFQFVEPRAPLPRPALPSSLKHGLGGDVDWTFAAFVSGTFLFMFGFGIVLSDLDPIAHSEIRTVPDALAHLVIEEPPPPEVQQETQQTDTPTETAQDTRTETRQNSSDSRSDSRDVTASSEAQASLADNVANDVMASLLGAANGDAAAGTFQNLLGAGQVDTSLGNQIQNATGTGVGGTGGPRVAEASGGGGSGTTGNLGTLSAGSGPRTQGDTGSGPSEVAVRRAGTVRASSGTEVGGSGTFDSAQVNSRLRGLQASINRCYETQLATNPTLEGRVGVRFTITESGGVSGVQVDSPNAALGTCVSSVIGRLRFNPGPVGGSVSYSTTFVFSSSG